MSLSLFVDIEMPYKVSSPWSDVLTLRTVCFPDDPEKLIAVANAAIPPDKRASRESQDSWGVIYNDDGDTYGKIRKSLVGTPFEGELPKAPCDTTAAQVTLEILY